MNDPSLRDLIAGLGPSLSSLGPKLPSGPLRMAWPKIQDLVADNVDAALGGKLIDVLGEVWASEVDVDLDAETGAHDVEISGTVTLGRHRIAVTLAPDLTLTVDGVAARRIGLSLSFDITVKGAVLTIRENALDEADLGPVEVKARLTCDGVTLPVTSKLAEFDALGTHMFHPALRFRRAGVRGSDGRAEAGPA